MIDYTVVVGIDGSTLRYLELNSRSWKHFHPEMWDRPWIAFYDPSQVSKTQLMDAGVPTGCRCIPWYGDESRYENQREKMLSGHVYVSLKVDTEWFLKIDVDAIAVEAQEWPKVEWFEDDVVLVGPSWGYWRSKGSKYTLVEWCEILEDFGDRHFGTPRMNWVDQIGSWDHRKGPKLRDKNRWVSWLAFQRTSWVRDMADRFAADYGPGMLPVPSHDTSLWAAARRSGAKTRQVGVKPGWVNRLTLKSCRSEMEKLGL